MNFRRHRDVLPSGLRVVTLETPHLHSALLTAWIRTGSRHETARTNGVSHFLEHLFFRGSARYPDTREMNAAVEEVGGNLNGVTTRDSGCYYTPLHPAGLGRGLDVLGDMLSRPALTQVEVERSIILEEMLDEVDGRGRDIDADNLSKMRLFGPHPLGFKIAGTRETVKRISHEEITAHYRQHYVTGNLVVAVAGPVERRAVLDRVARAFRHLPVGPASTELPPPPPPRGPWLQHVVRDEPQFELKLTFPAVPEHHPDFPALQLLRRILDDGLSSRLPYAVVESKGLAYELQCGLETFHDTGIFEVEAACAPDHAAQVVEEVLRVLGGVRKELVTEDELSRAARRQRVLLEFAQDSPSDLCGWFGGTELFRTPEPFLARVRAARAVTRKNVQYVAQRYLGSERLGLVAVGPRTGAKALRDTLDRAGRLLGKTGG
jgi:predicted Zn-dependent peptidase